MLCWRNRSSTEGMPSFRAPAFALGNLHFPHWLRLVGPREQLGSKALPVFHQVLRQLVDGHPVHAGTALVLPDSLQRDLDVVALDDPLHQDRRS
jgi:hypothetical protein